MDICNRHRIPLSHIYDAAYDCLKGKRSSPAACLFDVNMEKEVFGLWKAINDRTYEIGKSYSLIVDYPVKREIFAACFRDRVIHHYVALRLIPLFEELLPRTMTSNRKGLGTSSAIKQAEELIREVSENYTRDAWIWKFDLKGFFMSIDKRILWSRLGAFIEEKYHDKDKDVLLWLTEKVVFHCPQKNNKRLSPVSAWNGLPKEKSLYEQDDYHGLPIGNLTSQIFANFYLYPVVKMITDNGFKAVQFVDDILVVASDKERLKRFIPVLRDFCRDVADVKMHPRKSTYMQHYTKGVTFLGSIIKPNRIYAGKRIRGRFEHVVANRKRSGKEKDIESFVCTVNSYLGLMNTYRTRKLRERAGIRIISEWKKVLYFLGDWSKVNPRKKYKIKSMATKRERANK